MVSGEAEASSLTTASGFAPRSPEIATSASTSGVELLDFDLEHGV
jgi:hypothetical protein